MDYFMLAAKMLKKNVNSFAGLSAMNLHHKAITHIDHGRDVGRIIKL